MNNALLAKALFVKRIKRAKDVLRNEEVSKLNKVIAAVSASAFLAAATACLAQGNVLMKSDFEQDPKAAGWSFNATYGVSCWENTLGHVGGRCIASSEGSWSSPMFEVKPFEFYKVTFWSKVKPRPAGVLWPQPQSSPSSPDGYPAVWSAVSYDANKKALISDQYWGIDLSNSWVKNEYVTYGKENSRYMNMTWQPYVKSTIMIDNVSVEPIDYLQAASWVDEQYSKLPKFKFTANKDRWKYIPKTMETLKNGGTIKIVMLGDSICNDTSNSSWQALVQRMYPKAKLEVISSVRGGTGNVWYQHENRIKEYVLDYNPDLLIIAGISQGNDWEAARSVIKQVRAVINPEIIYMTPVVGSNDPNKKTPIDAASQGYWDGMIKVCQEEGVERIDMMTTWKDYVVASGKPIDYFRRDFVHANMRGAVVLSKTIEAFFAPKK